MAAAWRAAAAGLRHPGAPRLAGLAACGAAPVSEEKKGWNAGQRAPLNPREDGEAVLFPDSESAKLGDARSAGYFFTWWIPLLDPPPLHPSDTVARFWLSALQLVYVHGFFIIKGTTVMRHSSYFLLMLLCERYEDHWTKS